MKAFSDYESIEVSQVAEIPVVPGGYVCAITNAEEAVTSTGRHYICVSLDIAEGEFKGCYTANYKSQADEYKKWKACLNLWIPTDDGSEQDKWSKQAMKGFMTALSESNKSIPNPCWDERMWITKKAKPVYIGMLFRNEEWEYNGMTGWNVRPFKACSVDVIRTGAFKTPKDKPLKNKSEYNNARQSVTDPFANQTPVNAPAKDLTTATVEALDEKLGRNNYDPNDFEEIIGDGDLPF